jgi:hypothetical protein
MKYIIEDNIDFYSELYKSLDKEEENQENKNICLITNQPLTEKFVKMDCGHTFNYIPLFYDIYNHKKKFNSMEASGGHLKNNEIRCPYCRNKQNGVLPYYEELELEKVNGVNIVCETKPTKENEYYTKCEYLTENPKFNDEFPESVSNNKFINCYSYGSKIISSNNYGDEKCYCYYHKKIVITNYKKDEKDKIKKMKEENKLKEKMEKMKQKEEDKKQKTQEKMEKQKSNKVKVENKINELTAEMEEENTILVGCVQILKSGPNKGCSCYQKIFQENLCKRHFQSKK